MDDAAAVGPTRSADLEGLRPARRGGDKPKTAMHSQPTSKTIEPLSQTRRAHSGRASPVSRPIPRSTEPAGYLLAGERLAELYLRELDTAPRLTREQEIELARRVESGDAEALRQLVAATGWLVAHFARRHRGMGLELFDLVQEGNIGLMRAAETFDVRRGFRFATYAGWWVRQSMGRAIANQGRTVRLPVHLRHLLRRINRTRQSFAQRHGREPDRRELAERLGVPVETVSTLVALAPAPVSLDAPMRDDESGSLEETMADEQAPSPEQVAADGELREEVRRALATLPEREQRILRMRFGVGSRSGQSLQQVGKQFHLTRERIRQIERRALDRLRHGACGCRLRALSGR